ncbi:reverse transcriptase domain-containing protein [Microbispora sp. NBRC 16548]|uniref:reverse transcriptase domain-containing protein n=1 Tax=Microbispora sp. NBRC 16548 TaxID=3030994 RepID=UPI0024A1876A|nr:reverse transcriptase domain-containing protein [Microbispora sp. NBRC 16548]GLX11170.1 hypothetical protein Misp03_80960 [Microbispora sp. NBRC 16548]
MRIGDHLLSITALQDAVIAERGFPRQLVPAPVTYAVLSRNEDVARWASRRLRGDFQPVPEQIVPVRKHRNGVRPIAELALRDRLAFRALVNRWKGDIPQPDRSATAYATFKRAPLEEECSHIVTADIVACYQYIDYDLLGRELIAQTGDVDGVDAVIGLLLGITGRRFGLPQQSAPSDVLAEVYVDVLERALLRRGLRVWRYNDDFLIASQSWSGALEAIDILEENARKIGLTLNDSKTLIQRRRTYETQLNMRQHLFQEIAEEAQLDLTEIDIGPYGDTIASSPYPDDVQTAAYLRVLELWSDRTLAASKKQAVLQLIPSAFSHLAGLPFHNEVVPTCMQMLRKEQTMTPHIARYLSYLPDESHRYTLDRFTELLEDNAYMTGWQALWLQDPFANYKDFPHGRGGERRREWLRSVFTSTRAGEIVQSAAAYTLARHGAITVDEVLGGYDRASPISRPVYSAALGALGTRASRGRVRSVTSEDELHRWTYDWAAEQQ